MTSVERNLVRFSLRPVLPLLGGTTAALEQLTHSGVPNSFFGRRYLAADRLALRETSKRRLVCFGTAGLRKQVGLDADNGEVVDIADSAVATPRRINASLGLFTATVWAMADRYPYYGARASLATRSKVARALGEEIRRIDPTAMARDQFWATFVDDVEIGDFATEEVRMAPTGQAKARRGPSPRRGSR